MWRIILTALIIVGVIFYLGFTYENTLTCILLYYAPSVANFFQCGYVIPAGIGPNGYIGNSTLNPSDVAQYNTAPFVSNITKVQSGIKTWKSFANYTANQPSQLNAFNVFTDYTNDEYVYYKPENVYAFEYITIVESYYNNETFSNYNPSLAGKVVNVSFVSGVPNLGIGHNNTPKHLYNLPYKITGMKLGSKGIVYWNLTEDFESNPTLINLNNISFANSWNMTFAPMGFYFANGTEVVLPNS